jgi:hypothetical protein
MDKAEMRQALLESFVGKSPFFMVAIAALALTYALLFPSPFPPINASNRWNKFYLVYCCAS